MPKFGLSLILLLVLINSYIFSQSDSSFILHHLKIYHEKNSEIICTDFTDNDFYKYILGREYLSADPEYYSYRIKLKNINKISIENGMHDERGTLIGAGIGFLCGFYFFGAYNTWYFKYDRALGGGVLTAIPFGVIGGLIGLFFPNYDDYDIYKVADSNKRDYIEKVFMLNEKHPIKIK